VVVYRKKYFGWTIMLDFILDIKTYWLKETIMKKHFWVEHFLCCLVQERKKNSEIIQR
jgi:hypothetical protein